jgi:hypothetical protein
MPAFTGNTGGRGAWGSSNWQDTTFVRATTPAAPWQTPQNTPELLGITHSNVWQGPGLPPANSDYSTPGGSGTGGGILPHSPDIFAVPEQQSPVTDLTLPEIDIPDTFPDQGPTPSTSSREGVVASYDAGVWSNVAEGDWNFLLNEFQGYEPSDSDPEFWGSFASAMTAYNNYLGSQEWTDANNFTHDRSLAENTEILKAAQAKANKLRQAIIDVIHGAPEYTSDEYDAFFGRLTGGSGYGRRWNNVPQQYRDTLEAELLAGGRQGAGDEFFSGLSTMLYNLDAQYVLGDEEAQKKIWDEILTYINPERYPPAVDDPGVEDDTDTTDTGGSRGGGAEASETPTGTTGKGTGSGSESRPKETILPGTEAAPDPTYEGKDPLTGLAMTALTYSFQKVQLDKISKAFQEWILASGTTAPSDGVYFMFRGMLTSLDRAMADKDYDKAQSILRGITDNFTVNGRNRQYTIVDISELRPEAKVGTSGFSLNPGDPVTIEGGPSLMWNGRFMTDANGRAFSSFVGMRVRDDSVPAGSRALTPKEAADLDKIARTMFQNMRLKYVNGKWVRG